MKFTTFTIAALILCAIGLNTAYSEDNRPEGQFKWGKGLYTGEYTENWPHYDPVPYGKGTWVSEDGRRAYTGEWGGSPGVFGTGGKGGQKHGKGIWTWADGTITEADYRFDSRHGLFTRKDKNGTIIYTKEYQEDKICTSEDVDHTADWVLSRISGKYDGRWKHGKPHGEGTFENEDGDKYAGGWKGGKLHEQGVWTWVDGKTCEGYFINGNHPDGKYCLKPQDL